MNPYLALILIGLFLLPANIPKQQRKISQFLSHTASDDAKPFFDKGLLLLHNFEYSDAAEQFIQAQQKDPSFVLAYWGEAMTYDHPIWRDLEIEKSRAALNKAGATPQERLAKAETEVEKDLMQSVNILFGEGSKPDRERAYSEYMGKLYTKYPDNYDVAAFYALSLLGIKKGWNEWEEYNERAAQVANKILEEQPDHAGGLHYLVHANDHPRYADEGLDAANKYGKVASYAGHALHMPSHIYLALGMWADVVRSNEVSWQASLNRKERKKLTNDGLSYHSHLWLLYGYLQQGRYKRASELLRNQVKMTEELPSAPARFHLVQMKGHYLFTTGDWNSSMAEIKIRTDDLDSYSRFGNMMIDGYKMFQGKDLPSISKLIDAFEKDLARATLSQKESEGITVCGATRFVNAVPTEAEILLGNRYLKQLKSMKAWLQKDFSAAEQLLKEALPKEGSVVIGPPVFLLSPHELYGQFLLERNRPDEAIRQFEKALAASPQRYVSLKGKLIASRALKDASKEQTITNELREILKSGDAESHQGLW